MNSHGELMEVAVAELKMHGIKAECRQLNGGHVEIAWQVVPEKQPRKVITSKTGSDWRGRMNLRAEVRRQLRADNVTLKRLVEPKPKGHNALAKALDLPQPDKIAIPDQISALQSEIGDLTQLVLRLGKIIASVRDAIIANAPPSSATSSLPPKPVNSRSVKIAEYLTLDRWISLAALERDTGLSAKQVKSKLAYLAKHGQVVVYRSQAKLKPSTPDVAPSKKYPDRPLVRGNGHLHREKRA